ncbi:acaloleptin A-like [Euwallacea fornicatus]|uniref:acaloleptin A-like n=1 Tax=Euwallacea fornicatus TaxID=995702 RepID=UPI00338EC946
MAPLYSTLILLALTLLYVSALPELKYHHPELTVPLPKPLLHPKLIYPTFKPQKPGKMIRLRRFVESQNPNSGPAVPADKKSPGWEVRPDLSRDQRGNTKGEISVKNHGENHDIDAGYGQVFRGPDKHSETWHVGGTIKW